MHRLILSPLVMLVENHLFPGIVQHGICHLLTGQLILLSPQLELLVAQLLTGNQLNLDDQSLEDARQGELAPLLEHEIIIRAGVDQLAPFRDYFLVRPRQNPAVSYRAANRQIVVARTSMRERHYSPSPAQLPDVIEETLASPAAEMLLLADGTKALAEVFEILARPENDLRNALTFLTNAERQLVKLAPEQEHLAEPFQPFNGVPRTFYVSGWQASGTNEDGASTADFHKKGIDDASWQFDWIEPTVSHSFRFPSPAFGNLSYGARFCDATFNLLATDNSSLKMLEVGGGTGSFASSFLDRAATQSSRSKVEYHLLDLAPTLFAKQQQTVTPYLSPEHHYLQNATELSLPEQKFDLIVANEVIADFPVAHAERVKTQASSGWSGTGAHYVEEFGLDGPDVPDAFWVNSGVFEFIRRAWNHLSPDGVLIMTEYGGTNRYPVRAYHLNHDEFSIQFGHVQKCARVLGFDCRILALKEFLSIDDGVEFLDGQEERILCLNHVLRKFGGSLPYAAVSRKEFEARWRPLADEIQLGGITFSPLRAAFHYGPALDQFLVAVLRKPSAA
jgi:hypothetical protein